MVDCCIPYFAVASSSQAEQSFVDSAQDSAVQPSLAEEQSFGFVGGLSFGFAETVEIPWPYSVAAAALPGSVVSLASSVVEVPLLCSAVILVASSLHAGEPLCAVAAVGMVVLEHIWHQDRQVENV